MSNVKDWRDRVPERVKNIVNIDDVAMEFERQIKENLSNGLPINNASTQARKKSRQLLKNKGVSSSDATHLLHVSEKTPYSGCGCCKHRKIIERGNYYG